MKPWWGYDKHPNQPSPGKMASIVLASECFYGRPSGVFYADCFVLSWRSIHIRTGSHGRNELVYFDGVHLSPTRAMSFQLFHTTSAISWVIYGRCKSYLAKPHVLAETRDYGMERESTIWELEMLWHPCLHRAPVGRWATASHPRSTGGPQPLAYHQWC